jgi:hypothetical protein
MEEDGQMASWGLTAGIPVGVRVPGIILLVLVGVFASALLVGAAGVGGGGGPAKHGPVQRQDQDQRMGPGDGGGHRPPAGGHG